MAKVEGVEAVKAFTESSQDIPLRADAMPDDFAKQADTTMLAVQMRRF